MVWGWCVCVGVWGWRERKRACVSVTANSPSWLHPSLATLHSLDTNSDIHAGLTRMKGLTAPFSAHHRHTPISPETVHNDSLALQ